MRLELFAYDNGFRVDKLGKLYNINGREYSTCKRNGKERFYIRRNKKTYSILVSRLQAFQKFGDDLYKYRLVRHLNNNPFDSSFKNIVLGKGSEIITPDLEKMHKTKRAFYLGYRVSKTGVLKQHGVDVTNKIFNNRFGYEMFCIPFKFKKSEFVFVHRLQAYQKYGDKFFEAECVRHLNGNCVDNSWGNIAIGSFVDNMADVSDEVKKRANLKRCRYVKYPLAFRKRLRKRYEAGETISDLARYFNMQYTVVSYIVKRKSLIDKITS